MVNRTAFVSNEFLTNSFLNYETPVHRLHLLLWLVYDRCYELGQSIQFPSKMLFQYMFGTVIPDYHLVKKFVRNTNKYFKIIKFNNEKYFGAFSLLQSFYYDKSKHTVTLTISDVGKRFMKESIEKSGFTKVSLLDILELRSVHSIKMYQFLRGNVHTGVVKIRFEELRDKFGLGDKYKSYENFFRVVLRHSVEEINQKTIIHSTLHSFTENGIKYIVFKIRDKNKTELSQLNIEKRKLFIDILNNLLENSNTITNDGVAIPSNEIRKKYYSKIPISKVKEENVQRNDKIAYVHSSFQDSYNPFHVFHIGEKVEIVNWLSNDVCEVVSEDKNAIVIYSKHLQSEPYLNKQTNPLKPVIIEN